MPNIVSYGGPESTTVAHWYQQDGGQPLKQFSKEVITSARYYSHKGFDTPDFRKRLGRGELLPFTSWYQFQSQGSATGGYTHRYGTANGWSEGNWPYSDSWRVPDDSELMSIITDSVDVDFSHLCQAAAGKIYSSGHDTLTFLAELHQIRTMFRGLLQRLIDALKSIGKLSDLWLEARYGWRTLVLDLISINDAIVEFDVNRTRYKERTGESHELTRTTQHSWADGAATYTFEDTWDIKLSVRGTVIMDIKPPRFGFNPITTAWELVPYSFVIDWFLSIGSWLNSMSALFLATQYAAAGGMHVEATKTCRLIDTAFNPGWSGNYATYGKSTVSLTTRVPSSISQLPFGRINLNEYKILDLLALLRQLVQR